MRAAIDRIEALNPTLNAVVHEVYDKALAAADDPALSDTPLRGVPTLVKDLDGATAGDPWFGGSLYLKKIGWCEPHDSHAVAQMRKAGLIVVGKTATPEFGLSLNTVSEAHGVTRNPWDANRSAGGSSGGSGAAVASGMVPLAHGGDGGGSIRAPASWNGLFGLKPSRGRVSNAPNEADPWAGMICRHVLTRSVRDSALLLDWLSKSDGGDPYVAPTTPRPYAEEVGVSPAGLRVGWLDRDPLGGVVDPAGAAAVRETARRLEDAGCIVEESFPAAYAEIDFPAMSSIASTWIAYQIATLTLRTGVVPDDADLMPGTRQALAVGRTMSGPDYVAAVERMHAWSRRMKVWWRDFDLLIAPTMPTSAPTFADIAALDLSDPVRRYDTMAFTAPFNMTGQPAASVPCAWQADGLPIGVQLIAGLGREDLIFRAAAHLETAAPWAGRRPPHWAD